MTTFRSLAFPCSQSKPPPDELALNAQILTYQCYSEPALVRWQSTSVSTPLPASHYPLDTKRHQVDKMETLQLHLGRLREGSSYMRHFGRQTPQRQSIWWLRGVLLSIFLALTTIGSTDLARALTIPAFPLKPSPNNRFLVDQNGMPFVMVGDSPQAMIGNLS